MTKPTTQYLDLDALASDNVKVLKFQGAEHKLVPVTVDAFIANVKAVQELGVSPSFEAEVDAVVAMLARAFPTFPVPQMRELPLEHLNKILDFAQNNDGTKQAESEAGAEGAANPQ